MAKWIKQHTVDDWVQEFLDNTKAVEQVDIILKRAERKEYLVTWELNCLRAYHRLHNQPPKE
jgi:hypothetical protein